MGFWWRADGHCWIARSASGECSNGEFCSVNRWHTASCPSRYVVSQLFLVLNNLPYIDFTIASIFSLNLAIRRIFLDTASYIMSSMDGDSLQYDDACHNLALVIPVSSQPTKDWPVVDSVEELQRITLFYLHNIRQPEHHSGMSAQARTCSISGPSIALVTLRRRPQAPPLPYQAPAVSWANIDC